ncbi:hypothetical protein CI238_13341, partial [Colletotrichum incanum]
LLSIRTPSHLRIFALSTGLSQPVQVVYGVYSMTKYPPWRILYHSGHCATFVLRDATDTRTETASDVFVSSANGKPLPPASRSFTACLIIVIVSTSFLTMVRGTEALLELLAPHQLLNGKWRAADVATLVGSLPQADGQGLLQTGHTKPHFQEEMAVWTGHRVRRKVTCYFMAADTEVSLAPGELRHELFQAFRAGTQPTTDVSAALVPSIRKQIWPRSTQLKDKQLCPCAKYQPLQCRQALKSAFIITFGIVKAGQAI